MTITHDQLKAVLERELPGCTFAFTYVEGLWQVFRFDLPPLDRQTVFFAFHRDGAKSLLGVKPLGYNYFINPNGDFPDRVSGFFSNLPALVVRTPVTVRQVPTTLYVMVYLLFTPDLRSLRVELRPALVTEQEHKRPLSGKDQDFIGLCRRFVTDPQFPVPVLEDYLEDYYGTLIITEAR